ncbi:MAG: YidB family protein [Burkholderiales bacterium]
MPVQNPSVFDSLVEAPAPAAADAALGEWLVRRLLAQGPANGLQQLVDGMRQCGLEDRLAGWLAGRAQPLAAADVERLGVAAPVLDHAAIDTAANAAHVDVAQVRARIGELLPEVVRSLMPRGEVPSWRALELGLTAMSKSLAAARTQSR